MPKNQDIRKLIGSLPVVTIRTGDEHEEFALPGHFSKSYKATVIIPENLLKFGTPQLFFDIVAAPDPYGARTLIQGKWESGLRVQPNKKTLVFVHGLASSVENAFKGSCADAIRQVGGYNQVVGLDYDWSQMPSVVSPLLAKLISGLGDQKEVDIEAHSYGTIVALGAIPAAVRAGTVIQNLILLGGPLHGTPYAQADVLDATFQNLPAVKYLLTWYADQFEDAQKNGVTDLLAPNSLKLGTLENAVYGPRGYPPERTILVAGNAPGIFSAFEKAADWREFVKDETGGTGGLGPSDGLVPVSSALFSRIPTMYAAQFAVNHIQIECNSTVENWVASQLSTLSPSPKSAIINHFLGLPRSRVSTHTFRK